MTGFTCRGAGRSPSGVPCLPRQRIKGFESRSEQDDSYICGSICDAERESHEEPARAHHGARRRPRRSARRPCFTSAKGPRWVRRSPAWPVQAGSCGSAKGSTCARSSPASGGVRRAPKSHPWRFRSSGARRSSRTEAARPTGLSRQRCAQPIGGHVRPQSRALEEPIHSRPEMLRQRLHAGDGEGACAITSIRRKRPTFLVDLLRSN